MSLAYRLIVIPTVKPHFPPPVFQKLDVSDLNTQPHLLVISLHQFSPLGCHIWGYVILLMHQKTEVVSSLQPYKWSMKAAISWEVFNACSTGIHLQRQLDVWREERCRAEQLRGCIGGIALLPPLQTWTRQAARSTQEWSTIHFSHRRKPSHRASHPSLGLFREPCPLQCRWCVVHSKHQMETKPKKVQLTKNSLPFLRLQTLSLLYFGNYKITID